MRLAWLTDIHLDFVGDAGTDRLCDEIAGSGGEAVLLGGDIAKAGSLEAFLRRMAGRLRSPLYFVLGNHDFYGGSVEGVRRRVATLTREGLGASWLGALDVVSLTSKTALVGHDGWGDAHLGDHWRSGVILNDFLLIEDLRLLAKADLARVLGELGDASAAHLRGVLPKALDRHEHVLVLTHVPPFRDACWHQGQISDDDWLPYFTCKAVGDALLEVMSARSDRRMTVLCGHTHSPGECRPLPNLRVLTGAARYGQPAIQQPLVEVD